MEKLRDRRQVRGRASIPVPARADEVYFDMSALQPWRARILHGKEKVYGLIPWAPAQRINLNCPSDVDHS
jgi:hypothetical protein